MKRKNRPEKFKSPTPEKLDKTAAENRIKILDARLGEGKGAKKERERLAGIISYEKKPISKQAFASKAEERRFNLAQEAKKKVNG